MIDESSKCTVQRLKKKDLCVCVCFFFSPANTSDFSSHRSAQSGYETHPEPYLVGKWGFFSGSEMAWPWNLLPIVFSYQD
jgi:hypothetical protein